MQGAPPTDRSSTGAVAGSGSMLPADLGSVAMGLPAELTAFAISLPVRLKVCTAGDLPALEWFGTLTHQREMIQQAFGRQQKGEMLILLAMIGEAPVGQVWVDFTRAADPDTGWIWALRVFPWLQGRGIGSRLLDAAEAVLVRTGCRRAELAVERANVSARRLYERRGYRRLRRVHGELRCVTPWGSLEWRRTDEWQMGKRLPRPEVDPAAPVTAWPDEEAGVL